MNDLKFTTAGNYMNSKIDDFIYQSGLIAAGCWDKFDDYDKKAIEKFGELIIKECISVIENLSPGYKDYREQIEDAFRRDCIEEIKQHFLDNK